MNEHIDDFLDYYYKFNFPTDYAVLIKGKWGTGKTWYIKNSLDKLEDEKTKYIYVSLNGVTNFDEIDNIFFQQLHPLLSSKGMTIAGKVLKGLLKTTIKIDLDGDNKADGSVNSQIPDIDIPEYLTNTEGYALVFDDLERCSMELSEILGYINQFVEHQGYKTVIIANEDELIEREKNNSNTYDRIKEKLIGQTFEINPDIDAAISTFFNQLSGKSYKSFCINNRNTFKDLYTISEHKNLRYVKHALWGFERLYNKFPDKIKAKEDLLLHLLKFYFIFSFEIKSGNLKPNHIGILRRRSFSNLLKEDEGDKENIYKNIIMKYNCVNFFDILLDDIQWEEILDKGVIRIDEIQNSLLNSNYFSDENTPAWRNLWHAIDLSDEEFDSNLQTLENEIENKLHRQVGIIKHITGLLLWLSDIDVIDKEKKDILNDAKLYVESLIDEKLLIEDDKKGPRQNNSWDGLVFFGKEFPEFKDFCQHIQNKINVSKEKNYANDGIDLLKLMSENTELFKRKLIPGHNESNSFGAVPILSYIKSDDFVSSFLSLTPSQKETTCFVFNERYKQLDINNKLLEELDWLESIKNLLVQHNKNIIKKNKISLQINKFVINNCIDGAIAELRKAKE